MDEVELLTVVDHFQLQSRGLVVVPDFDVPARGWKDCAQPAIIVTPDGRSHEAMAHLSAWHFHISDSAVTAAKRWRLVVYFPTQTKEEVPIGSKIMVSRSLKLEVDGES
jgi:hypothetical protein